MGRKDFLSDTHSTLSTSSSHDLFPVPTFHFHLHRKVEKGFKMSNPSLNHHHHHPVFRFRSRISPLLLIPTLLATVLLTLLVKPGSGLHPPQCQWDLYQDIERLRCGVQPGNNLIVEEEVAGIGPEHAKSLWVQCSDIQNQQYSQPTSGSGGDEELQVDSYFGSEKTSLKLSSESSGARGFVLSVGLFMAVPNLRELNLENCRIAGITPGALGYLPYLQNLTIRAHTSLTSWSSPRSSSSTPPPTLEIKPGVLRGLPELRHLDLSTTSLSSLPNDFLCFLPSLNYLNLTGCWLRDFRSIGIAPSDPTNPHNCGNQIRVLDLSANHFSLLPPATFSTVSRLEELRIDLNSITSASERALLGLSQLKIFSLAGNQLSSLQPEFFKDNRHLQEIYLNNNSLAVLAPGLLSGLEHLVVVDLSNNELTSEWVIGETFRGLVRLVVLNLANNQLTRVDSALFRDLYSLQVLNLENNQLSSVVDDAFSGMYNMHTLLLSHNHLKTIEPFICNGLFVLSFIALDNNRIETVGDDSFKNCSNIMDLNLSGNRLTRVPSAISPLSLLRTLDLGENKITEIGNASYASLPNLYGLRLTGNEIGVVPKDAFANLASLKIVNLAKNNITSIQPGAFDNNPNLQAVRLDSNKLSDISDLFKNIPNLLWLNISANQLIELKYQEFPPRLQWLDLRSNKISNVGNCLEIDNLRIRNLDISHNLITEIGSSNLPDSIENLIMSYNLIHQVQPYTFFRKPNLSRVDISHNQLVRLDQNSLRLSPGRINNNNDPSGSPSAEIFLGHNPLNCDCTMDWLQSMNTGDGSGDSSGQYPIIQDSEDVKCTLSFDRGLEPIPYMGIAPSQFLCKYESHCFSSCQCCDFDACDCQSGCPKNCSCYHDQGWGSNVVDCSLGEQTYIPGRIPMDVTELYLDGNVFPSLDSHSFIGRKALRALYLNGSHIEGIQNRTFHGLKALRILHLEVNFLERLDGWEFDDLEGLEELYLHQNSLSFISNETFARMVSLRRLTLHGNNFVDLAIWSVISARVGGGGISGGHALTELTLRGNEWSCECQFATNFKDWLIENRAKISDASQVQCVDQVSPSSLATFSSPSSNGGSGGGGSGSSGSLTSTRGKSELIVVRLLDQRSHRCSQVTDLSIREPTTRSGEEFEWSGYIPLLLVTIGLLLLVGILTGLAYYWRKTLRVWFYANCGLRLEGSCREPHEVEKDKLFDAFVSYSSKDEAWVRQVFAAELERNDPPYRLCLRYRDLPTGGTYLADTIVQAAEASRRTILVLSHHFLKGEWSRSDVKSAHHSVLKDRHRKVIIILLGDLPSKDLDPDIRLYLKNHTYLSCDDKKFWDKLRYALPDVKVKAPLFRGSHTRSSTHHQQQQQQQQIQQQLQNGGNNTMSHRSMPPPPPPHYNQYPHPLPQPPIISQSQPQYHAHQPSPNLTSSHHHLLNSANNSANNTLLAQQQQNMLNALNSGGVFLPNGMNLGSHPHHMAPNIVPLVSTGGGSGSGSLRSSQQRQYHTIVNSSLNNGGHGANNNRHNSAVHI